jgi:radical SAM protein with 4Fe4S-binding SPASM domain
VTFDWEKNDAVKKVRSFEKGRSLSFVVLELTEVCNFNCIWCYNAANKHKGRKHMPWEKAETLAEIFADSGIRQVTCSGGEPMLYPHLDDFIRRCADLGIIVHMNTNGYLFTRKRARELKKAGLSQIQTNIDSLDAGRHDSIRGKDKSFERAVRALKNAKEAGMTAVSQTVLTKTNECEIGNIFRFARSIGVQRCRVWDMVPSGSASENMKLKPTDFIKTLGNLCEYAKKTGALSVESADPLFPANLKPAMDVYGGVCAASMGGFTTMTVDGDVLFCATLREKLYNAFEAAAANGNSIKEIHKEKVAEFLKDIYVPDICRSCEQFPVCHGGCPTRRRFNPQRFDYWCKYFH